MFTNDEDTIIAEATPGGRGGLSLLRLSGPQSVAAFRQIAPDLPQNISSHRAYFVLLKDKKNDVKIDEVIATIFLNGKSYTGQETVEISSHGNPQIVSEIIEQLILTKQVRLAQPGEFTYRAVLNGRMDLVQAESVLDLIHGQSKLSRQWALRQLDGELSNEYKGCIETLTSALAHIEAQIDFSEQDIDPKESQQFIKSLSSTLDLIESKIKTFSIGKSLSHGLKICLIGPPNSGKSSLLNRLAKKETAIVSDIPGTTRDSIEVEVSFGHYNVTFVDTAGIRESSDPIEKIGIERSLNQYKNSDVIFYLVDQSEPVLGSELSSLPDLESHQDLVLVKTKSDLTCASFPEEKLKWPKDLKCSFSISTVVEDGLSSLNEFMSSYLKSLSSEVISLPATSNRQLESLIKIAENLKTSINSIEELKSPELIAFDLQSSLEEFYNLLGLTYDDQVMDRVFSDFCLGK